MPFSTVGVTEPAAQPTSLIDNWALTRTGVGEVKRQIIRLGGATETPLAEVSPNQHLLTTTAIEQLPSINITVKAGDTGTSAGSIAPATGLVDSSAFASTGGEPPTNSHVTFEGLDDHESAHVQITGSWTGSLTSEASLDGTNWFPTNLRRNAAGNQRSNILRQNGLWRGTMAGTQLYRIRALGDFSGTASIVMSGAKLSGTYLLSEVTTQSQQEYLGSAAGGNVMWSANSQDITLGNAAAEVPIMTLVNGDSSGGRTIVLYRLSMGASGQTRFRRYRSSALARTSGGARRLARNQGTSVLQTAGGTESAAVVHSATGSPLVVSGVTVGTDDYGDQSYIPTGGGQDRIDFQGGVRLPPGHGILITAIPVANNQTASVTFVYSDGSTLT